MKTVPLKRVATIVAGQSPASDDVEEFTGRGLPFLQGNAEFGDRHPAPIHRCDSANKKSRNGDVLLSVRAPVGALNIADRSYGIGRGLVAIQPSTDLYGRFCWWWMQSVVEELRAVATGSTYEAVTGDDVGSLRVPSVDADMQLAIANLLDTETARIDALIATKRRFVSVLGERVLATLDGLIDEPFAPLRRFATVQSGVTVDAGRGAVVSVRRPYLRVANVQDGWLDLTEISEIDVAPDVVSRCTLQPGDVVMTEANGNPSNIGRGTVWRGQISGCMHQNHVFAIRVIQRRLLPEFLALVTQSAHGRQYFRMVATQVGIATISKQKLLDFPVPALAVGEQRSRLSLANRELQRISVLGDVLDNQIALLRERRQALITAAVTGQLDIPGAA